MHVLSAYFFLSIWSHVSAASGLKTVCLEDWELKEIQGVQMCHSAWLKIDEKLYTLVNSTTSFTNVYKARKTCQILGGDMAALATPNITDQLFGIVRSIKNVMERPAKIYIGYNDINIEDTWQWFDGTSGTYNNWAEGEPNSNYKENGKYNNEDCVVAVSKQKSWNSNDIPHTNWQDYPCCIDSGILSVLCSQDTRSERTELPPENDDLARVCYSGVNDCASNPCMYMGTCLDELMGYKCWCPEGYTGQNCETGVTCPPIPMYRYDINSTTEPYKIRTAVTYSCKDGVLPSGSKGPEIAVCDTTGNWKNLIECEEEDIEKSAAQVEEEEQVEEAPGSEVIGILGLIFVMAELGLFVLMDLELLSRQFSILVGNVKSRFCPSSSGKEPEVVVVTCNSCPLPAAANHPADPTELEPLSQSVTA